MLNGRALFQPQRRTALGAGAALLVLAVSGCTALRPVKSPADYIESVQPKVVRVYTTSSDRFLMTGAHIENDTLMGFVAEKGAAVGTFKEMPWGDVTKIEAQQWAGDLTVAAVAGGLLAWAGFTYLVIHHVQDGGI